MGVNLSDIVESREITLESLIDKAIAVDAFNWIYQFLSIIRQKDGESLKDSRGRVTSHFSGLFYRTIKFMEAGIKPVYVFDGERHEFKKSVTEKRRDVREEAKKEWKAALERKDLEEARKYAQRSTTITSAIVEDSKKLLQAMGIPCVQAVSEGEAQCAYMCKQDLTWCTASQDFDSLLFGTPRLVRNLSISGRKKRGNEYVTVNPEIIELSQVLENLGISHSQLVILGMLVGTDYNPVGVKGIGPKKALELVREKKALEEVFSSLDWECEAAPEDVYSLFMNPDVVEEKPEFTEFDEDEVKKILCDEHDFSEERIDSAIKKLKEKPSQKSLSSWFK
ncbi:MAG: flap endonuclease-1 [Candidatus Aenigmarchaeota archaeon]|nr:flap endonuclease-1 [Candidatus Aenigmarchaeota archaeon]